MKTQNNKNYTFIFESAESPHTVFETLLDVRKWWVGLYGEDIKGSTNKLNGEFTFRAGDGAHYTKQKLVELIPDKRIVWLVIDSNLNFVETPNEWTGTKICFDISKQGDKTHVRFTHEGLVPEFECYDACSSAWGQYMQQFVSFMINKVKV